MFNRFIIHPRFGCGSHHNQKWWRALGKALLSEGYLREKQMGRGSFGASVGELRFFDLGNTVVHCLVRVFSS